MTRRQEVVTVVVLLAWIGGCSGQFIKCREAMADEVAMAKFEREFLPDLVARDKFYSEAREKFEETFGFDDSEKSPCAPGGVEGK